MARIELGDLLRREDSHVEWKRGVADVEDVVKTLTAFANDLDGTGRGGWVVCGVEEQSDSHGFPIARLVASRPAESERFRPILSTGGFWSAATEGTNRNGLIQRPSTA